MADPRAFDYPESLSDWKYLEWLTIGGWAAAAIKFLTSTFGFLFSFIRSVLLGAYDGLETALNWPPSLLLIVIFAALALWARGVWFAAGTLVGLLLIDAMGQWQNAMYTLAMVVVAAVLAVMMGVPVGIAAARYRWISTLLRPALDFMQTMPALVYLIPAVVMFRVGVVPGIIATIIFSMPPGIRLTELGIRQVDAEVVEAGHAFGSTPARILRQIQLPLALPTIMAGVNQVIMLAFSMVVLAGIVGAPGLGQQVLQAVQRVNVGLGVEAGLSVVILAIFLDRVTAALGARSRLARLEKAA